MVAEIADPANALYYLDRFGLQLKPHIVLLGIILLRRAPLTPKATGSVQGPRYNDRRNNLRPLAPRLPLSQARRGSTQTLPEWQWLP
jgi:hypothetical protein